MVRNQSEFQQALERICSGSEEAVWEFIEAYGPHIQRVVRRRLNQRMRSTFDTVDFLQMVWASFFADPQRIAGMHEPEELIRYLVAMARNKVIEESRRQMRSQKRDVSREHPLDQELAEEAASARSQHQATPSQIAIARERWRHLLHDRSERDRRIVELRVSGATFVEIGESLGIHERTAREVIENLAAVGGR